MEVVLSQRVRQQKEKEKLGHPPIAKAILLSRYSEKNLMALVSAAYFDASGKQQGYPFLTMVGATAPIKKWIRFEKQ